LSKKELELQKKCPNSKFKKGQKKGKKRAIFLKKNEKKRKNKRRKIKI
jgi:hypothetical protein